jgi:hypothetical protein
MNKRSPTATDKIDVVRPSEPQADGELLFDGRKIAMALAFHLSEEKPEMSMPRGSAESLAQRLVSARVQLHVTRKLWARLTNQQRLSILAETIGKHATPWA